MKKRSIMLLVGAVTASMLLSGCSGSKGLETDELKISVYKGVEIEEVEKPGEVTDEGRSDGSSGGGWRYGND